MKVYALEEAEREPYLSLTYEDVSAAFAWYLENENQGRPIILAGFSQGADMCYRLLEEYFGDEALQEQLVAVYAIGWPCTEEMTQAYPQIRPAAAADDVGVVVSFDCEAPELEETFINPVGQRAYTINPLNWKTDGTPADRTENLGACFTRYSGEIKREEAQLCGCYLNGTRGVVKVTDLDPADYPPYGERFPTYFDTCLFLYRALHDGGFTAAEDVRAYAEELEAALLNGEPEPDSPRSTAQMAAECFAGMSVDEYRAYVRAFMAQPAYGFDGMTYGEGFYLPMLSLVEYLYENDFTVFISSGSERLMVRELIDGRLDAWIPPDRVIGSTFSLAAINQGDKQGRSYTYSQEDEVLM